MLADPHSAKTPSNRAHAASYIASMAEELAVIAKRHGLDTLGYLLDMTRLEAENASIDGD